MTSHPYTEFNEREFTSLSMTWRGISTRPSQYSITLKRRGFTMPVDDVASCILQAPPPPPPRARPAPLWAAAAHPLRLERPP